MSQTKFSIMSGYAIILAMVAAIHRSYRWTLGRLITLGALIATIVLWRPVSSHAASILDDAYDSVFSDVSVDPEELKASGHLSAACYGYGYSYGQGYYYSQAVYYSQGTYTTTFTKNATIQGSFTVTNRVDKGSGSFLIDHPLDPQNKLLYHSFVESPDAKNLYDGIVSLDARGEATIVLPDYFMALNEKFVYQLKPIGKPQPNLHIKNDILNNAFTITGGEPGGRVSWQVTGNRHDAYFRFDPIIPEVAKSSTTPVNVGELQHSDIYSELPSLQRDQGRVQTFTRLRDNLDSLTSEALLKIRYVFALIRESIRGL